ncbi:hypothetical protein BD413DRAFT_580394 [Trametes elegans]|nr:hypothetical protein BD413DRAFT_580394 [Trametes elegans]
MSQKWHASASAIWERGSTHPRPQTVESEQRHTSIDARMCLGSWGAGPVDLSPSTFVQGSSRAPFAHPDRQSTAPSYVHSATTALTKSNKSVKSASASTPAAVAEPPRPAPTYSDNSNPDAAHSSSSGSPAAFSQHGHSPAPTYTHPPSPVSLYPAQHTSTPCTTYGSSTAPATYQHHPGPAPVPAYPTHPSVASTYSTQQAPVHPYSAHFAPAPTPAHYNTPGRSTSESGMRDAASYGWTPAPPGASASHTSVQLGDRALSPRPARTQEWCVESRARRRGDGAQHAERVAGSAGLVWMGTVAGLL